MADLLAGEGRIREALPLYQRAITLDPDFAEAHNGLGLALLGQGDWDGAAAQFAAAVRFNPAMADARANLAMVEQWRRNRPAR
jgi:Flp pilus assembly protein TadD